MTVPRYIVVYKDSGDAETPTRYFGPFLERFADEFRAGLPMPQAGGHCSRHVLQPHGYNDATDVHNLIMHERMVKVG